MEQLTLWQETPALPGSELIGKTALYGKRGEMTIERVLAHTEQWGTLYQLRQEGASPTIGYLGQDFTLSEK